MNRALQRVNGIMRSERRKSTLPLELLLLLISLPYGAAVRLRGYMYKNGLLTPGSLPCKVVSIGNLTVGGTGKTPMSIYVAKIVRGMGLKAAVVSRGYKSGAGETGGIVSDGKITTMTPDEAGDEPYLMAEKLTGIPVLIGKDRFAIGKRAIEEFHADVLVLDDAFQHLALHRDLDLLLLDHARPFGNRHLVPRGPLREPVSQLARADAVIFTRSDRTGAGVPVPSAKHPMPENVFKSYHRPYFYKAAGDGLNTPLSLKIVRSNDAGLLKNRKAIAFSGLAVNKDFRDTVCSFGCRPIHHLEFPDHHAYTDRDIRTILTAADEQGADLLLTTEKDYVRVMHRRFPSTTDLVVFGIETEFGDHSTEFSDYLRTRLEAK